MATAEILVERQEPIAATWVLPRQIPELDGVRGLAILFVLICHSTMWLTASTTRRILEQGKIGVDLFFVLSGFLITGILLDTNGRPRAMRNFYVRRALRIWPLYFGYITLTFLFFQRMLPANFSHWTYLLLLQNFFYWSAMGPFLDPTWSLAVEEQFYLIWPWVAFHVKRETVLKICCAVLVLSPVIRCLIGMRGADPAFIYANTLCRLDGIAMGAMIAAWVRSPQLHPDCLLRFVRAALTLGIAGAAFCYAVDELRFAAELRYSFVALAFGGLLGFALLTQSTDTKFARLLRSPSLTHLGRISFALYLFNLPIYAIMHGHFAARIVLNLPRGLAEPATLLLANAVLLFAAVCSWKFLESPILRLKSRLAPR